MGSISRDMQWCVVVVVVAVMGLMVGVTQARTVLVSLAVPRGRCVGKNRRDGSIVEVRFWLGSWWWRRSMRCDQTQALGPLDA